MERRAIVVGVTGASGMPLAKRCLEGLRADGRYETHLIVSDGARVTIGREVDWSVEGLAALADVSYAPSQLDAAPASGTFPTVGMLIVPCSMKTIAGICTGYASDLLLRAADVTIKERRLLVLAARESPLSPLHLRNLHELSLIEGVRIVPPMLGFYHRPETIDDLVAHCAAKLLEPFGIELSGYRRWT